MGKMNYTQPHWSPKMLLEALERYVVRTRLLPPHRDALGDLTNTELFNTEKAIVLLDRLVEKANGRLDIYEPTTALINDLNIIHNFPNNAEFLGMPNQLNFSALPRYMQDTKGLEFMSKSDVYLLVFRNYLDGTDDQISPPVLMSLGNKITRQLKNCYEIIPTTIIDLVCSYSMDCLRTKPVCQLVLKVKTEGLKLSKYTVDELFAVYSKFFDEDFDGKLLKQLKQALHNSNVSRPIRSNEDYYETILLKIVIINEGVQAIVKQFPEVFLPYSHAQNRSKKHQAVVRVFIDADEKFFMAKDLEFALTIALKNKLRPKLVDGVIPIETAEEKQRGVLNSVSWDEFEKILKCLHLKIEDITIIEHEVTRTTRNIAVPLISQYGTHCKLATDAFFDVFENVSTGLRLFQGVSKENLPKVFDWFAELHDVFSDTKIGRYFVETWKIDQIIDQAYKELKPYVTERIYELPNKFNIGFTKEQVIKEITLFSPNFKLDQNVISSMHFKFISKYNVTNLMPRFIHQIYEHCVRLEFLARNSRFAKFIHNQGICKVYPRFACECAKEDVFVTASETAKNLEILSATHVEACNIKYDDSVQYSVVAENGVKYYDNLVSFHKALDGTLVNLNTNDQELLALTYKAQAAKYKHNSEFSGVFYLSEEEVAKFCEETRAFYNDSIKNALLRGEAQKASISQTAELDWDNIWRTFRMFFPTDDAGIFECVKRNVKRRPKATEKGLVGSLLTQLTSVCRHGQMTFQRCVERMKSLKDYMKFEKEHRIVLRMMSEMRIQDNKLWHMFTKEVFEAMKLVLRAEKRLHLMRDRIEKWEIDWYDSEHYTVMGVAGLEPMLRVLGIDLDKFLVVPDIQFTKALIELPLRMDYGWVTVLAPNGELAFHYTQAQLMIFQVIACDIDWNCEKGQCCEHAHSTESFKKEIINSMKSLESGYVSASEVDAIIGRLSDDDTYYVGRVQDIRTPLNICHGKKHNDKMSKDEFMKLISQVCDNPFTMAFHSNNFFQALAYENVKQRNEFEIWRIRYVFMDHWLDWVLEEDEDEELKKDIQTAWTVCLGHLKISSFLELKKWRKRTGAACNEFTDLKLLNSCAETWKKCQEFNTNYKESDLIREHHWDRTVQKKKSNYTKHTHSSTKNSCSSTSSKHETPKNEKTTPKEPEKVDKLFSTLKRGFFNKPAINKPVVVETLPKKTEETHLKKKKKTVEEVLDKLFDSFPKLMRYICDREYEPMDELEELIEEHLQDEMDDEDFDCLTLMMQETSELKKLERKLESYLDFKIESGGHYFKKKKGLSNCCSDHDEKEDEEEGNKVKGGLYGHIENMFKRMIERDKEEEVVKAQKKEKPPKRKEFPGKKGQQKSKQQQKEEPLSPPVPTPPAPPVKKVITETKIVESCEKCRDINQETIKNTRLIESFERRIGEFEKVLQNKDTDMVLMKSQMVENKKKYREEIQHNREELASRDARIQQLQQELKEVYEDFKIGREELYMEAEKNSKIASENMRKMRIELENTKFADNHKTKQISDLTTENKQLKLRIEIFEENRDVDRIKELESRLAEMESEKETSRNVEDKLKSEIERCKKLENRFAEMEEQSFLSAENYEKELEDRNVYIQSIEEQLAMFESMSYSGFEQEIELGSYPDSSQIFIAPEYYEHQKIQEKIEEYENILNFDRGQLIGSVQDIVNKFVSKCNNPEEISLAKSELANFKRKYDVYHMIVEEEYVYICQNPEIRFEVLKNLPSFPQPFSTGFIEKYEMMLKNWDVEEGNEENFLTDENYEKELEDKNCYIQSIEHPTKFESVSYSRYDQQNEYNNYSDLSKSFIAPENYENQKIQEKIKEYENILNFDREQLIRSVEDIVKKFVSKCKNPEEVSMAKSELANFSRKYDMYHRIVDEEYVYISQNPRIRFDDLKILPSFPQPFSAVFIEKYEMMLKSWDIEENLKVEIGNGKELEDTECLTCATNVHYHQSSTKCSVCCRKYHSQCVPEWMKTNSVCPICHSLLPDPREFPRL